MANTSHAKFDFDPMANSQFTTVRFLSLFGLFITCTSPTSRAISTIYTLYNVFPRKDAPSGSSVDITPLSGSKSPKNHKKGACIGTFRPKLRKILKLVYYRYYCTDSNQILHSDKDCQMLFVGGPHV